MIDMNGIAAAIGVPCTISGIMQEHLQLWETLYCNQAAWVNQRVRSLQIPAVVSRELKRLTLTEFDLTAADSQLQEILQRFFAQTTAKAGLRHCLRRIADEALLCSRWNFCRSGAAGAVSAHPVYR